MAYALTSSPFKLRVDANVGMLKRLWGAGIRRLSKKLGIKPKGVTPEASIDDINECVRRLSNES